MIRPAAFGFNPETADSNEYQQRSEAAETKTIQKKALAEFNAAVEKLKSHGIDVYVLDDTPEPVKPDAVFPNNWLATLPGGKVFIFPMFTKNRRLERRPEIIEFLREKFQVTSVTDLSPLEEEETFLEGTGSMVMNHFNKMVYACLSPRTTEKGIMAFCEASGYKPLIFKAYTESGQEQYHTNVVMCIGETFALASPDAITDPEDRVALIDSLIMSDLDLIPITRRQAEKHFAGNALHLLGKNGQRWLVIGKQAYESLTEDQVQRIKTHCGIIPLDVSTIEKYGGGSARCMICELYF